MGLAFVLTDLGALGGNNLVVLVAAVIWAAVVVDGALGWLNLRGVRVVRHLPEELFARTGARGHFEVVRTGRLPLYGLVLGDRFATVAAPAVIRVDCRVPAWWRVAERGALDVGPIQVRSTFPFGLFQHRVERQAHGEVLVYPWAGEGRGRSRPRGAPLGEGAARGEGSGDLRDLRPYRPGDRLRSIHAGTSARVGRPMVMVREAEEVVGRVIPLPGEPTETDLEQATGAVLEAVEQGVPVGLDGLDPELRRPRAGVRWRRRLLCALANVPRSRP